MTLDEAIKHCEEQCVGNDACSKEHRQLAEWLKELKTKKQSYNMGYFEGVNAGFKMMEQVLDREDVPDPMSKELLRLFVEHFRKENENTKQKFLNHGD